jgi:hypothetical protein
LLFWERIIFCSIFIFDFLPKLKMWIIVCQNKKKKNSLLELFAQSAAWWYSRNRQITKAIVFLYFCVFQKLSLPLLLLLLLLLLLFSFSQFSVFLSFQFFSFSHFWQNQNIENHWTSSKRRVESKGWMFYFTTILLLLLLLLLLVVVLWK